MRIKILKEEGYNEAMLGLSLNKKQEKFMYNVALSLAGKGGGHDQFMRHIIVWLDITAPATWWRHFDKYHFAETQSESSMHCLKKHGFSALEFSPNTAPEIVQAYAEVFVKYNDNLNILLDSMPHGTMYRRIVTTNYAQIDTIIKQRGNHRYKEWKEFCEYLLYNLEHNEFLKQRG